MCIFYIYIFLNVRLNKPHSSHTHLSLNFIHVYWTHFSPFFIWDSVLLTYGNKSHLINGMQYMPYHTTPHHIHMRGAPVDQPFNHPTIWKNDKRCYWTLCEIIIHVHCLFIENKRRTKQKEMETHTERARQRANEIDGKNRRPKNIIAADAPTEHNIYK